MRSGSRYKPDNKGMLGLKPGFGKYPSLYFVFYPVRKRLYLFFNLKSGV